MLSRATATAPKDDTPSENDIDIHAVSIVTGFVSEVTLKQLNMWVSSTSEWPSMVMAAPSIFRGRKSTPGVTRSVGK